MGFTLLATTDTQIIRVAEALYNLRPGTTYMTASYHLPTSLQETSRALQTLPWLKP